MKEITMNVNLSLWYIKPEYNKNGRQIRMRFLCFTLNILKNKI